MTRLHPLVALERAGRWAVQIGAIPVVLFAIGSAGFGEFASAPLVTLLAMLGAVLGAAYGLAWFLRFEYELTENTLDITSGVIARREREIPYGRIQTVDVTRTIVHRLVGVAVVDIETAGGGSTEASLDFVSATEAERIRRLVRTRRESVASDRPASAGPGAAGPIDAVDGAVSSEPTDAASTGGGSGTEPPAQVATPGADGEVLFRLSSRELLVYSLSTFRTGSVALVVFALPVFQGFVSRPAFVVLRRLGGATSLDTLTVSGALVTVAVLGTSIGAAAYLVSVVYGAVTYYGFTLGRRGDEFVYECGLFQRYSGSIPAAKVQSLTLTENVPMRRFGYAGLTLETAGYSGGDRGSRLAIGAGPPSAIPAASREVALGVARRIEDVDSFEITPPPRAARRRYAVRYALVVGVVVLASGLLARSTAGFDAWYLTATLFAFAPVAGHLKWRHRGYSADDSHVVLRSGFWSRQSTIVPYERLQTMTRTRTVFQRRLDLADFIADTASSVSITGGAPTAFDLDATIAARLHGRCRERLQARLQQRESGDS